jgi:hypothetical protein
LFKLILELDLLLELVNSFSMSLLELFLVLGYSLNLDRILWSTLLDYSLL